MELIQSLIKSLSLPSATKFAEIFIQLENLEKLADKLDDSETSKQVQSSICSLKQEIEAFFK